MDIWQDQSSVNILTIEGLDVQANKFHETCQVANWEGTLSFHSKCRVLRVNSQHAQASDALTCSSILFVTGSGRIQFKQFLNAMEIKMKEHKLDEDLKSAFQVFDKDGNGTIP